MATILRPCVGLLASLLGLASLGAQDIRATGFRPRANYGARLEVPDKVIHGAGQDPSAFQAYFQVLGQGRKPSMYMSYLQLKGDLKQDFARLGREMLTYENREGAESVYLIAQVGLAMTNDGHPESCYDERVAAGEYDQAIETLCDCIADLGHPVLLRIGYEFNGTAWNGYHPEAYRRAFIRISKALRAHNLEAAAVWDAAGEADFMGSLEQYYPGDEWVDWWGINLFSGKADAPGSVFKDPAITRFMEDAQKHKKPVLIGESTPRYTGVLKGEESWNAWYGEYFDFIHAWPGVKAFSYINWDWSKYPQWKNWGDARIEANRFVRDRYDAELAAGQYCNGSTETAYRRLLGTLADPLQVGPPDLRASWSKERAAAELAWECDGKGVLRYDILANGTKAGSAAGRSYVDVENGAAGETLRYSVRAVNGLGEPGVPSNEAAVQVPSVLTRIKGGFGDGPDGWKLNLYGGATAEFRPMPAGPAGREAARIEIIDGKGSAWFAQFCHPMRVYRGKTYTVTFTAWADRDNLPAEVWIQQTHPPFAGLVSAWPLTPGKSPKTHTIRAKALEDDTMNLTFMLGKIPGRAVVFLEGISVVEE